MFDLRQLQCFVAVGEELHFGRAAKRINMTQPPLTRQIQGLEHELHLQLLVRTSRSVQLTPAGKAFLREAKRLLGMADDAARSATRIAHGESGLIRLAFTAGSSYEFLPKLLYRAGLSLKDTEFELSEMISRHQVDALRSNSIDVGLQRMPADLDGLEGICVAREKMLVAIPKAHRLAKGRLPCLSDFAGENFINYSPRDSYYFHNLVKNFLAVLAEPPNYVQHVSQFHSILALVSAGLGLAITPESARLLHFDQVVLRRMRTPAPLAQLHLVWNSENDNPAVPHLIRLIRQYFPT
jgi:DNA-binding transcriptional LysR family regulator